MPSYTGHRPHIDSGFFTPVNPVDQRIQTVGSIISRTYQQPDNPSLPIDEIKCHSHFIAINGTNAQRYNYILLLRNFRIPNRTAAIDHLRANFTSMWKMVTAGETPPQPSSSSFANN